jgi:hypothetical protein
MDRNTFFARTMHTPDDPERARLRAALRQVSKTLLPLHRSLIDAAKVDFAEATRQEVPPPTTLLRLINDDPFFAWLKPVTALIVDIDEMVRIDFDAADVARIVARVSALFAAGGEGTFAAHYLPLLQREVDVAIGHAALRKAMTGLTSTETA